MAFGDLRAKTDVRRKYHNTLLFVITCLQYQYECLAYLTAKPQNAAVVVGSNVSFSCVSSSTDRIKWNFTCNDCIHPHLRKRQPVDAALAKALNIVERVSDKRHDLVINNVTLKHSGVYTCIDRNGNGQIAFAELTVLHSASHVSLLTCPRDAIVHAGDDVVLQAATRPGSEITWFRANDAVYSGTRMDYVVVDERHDVIKTRDGQVDFVVRDATSDDAGLYTARDEIHGKEASANLVVIDDTVSGVHTVRLSASELECRCTIKFWGNLVPSITWVDVEEKIVDAQLKTNVDSVHGEKMTLSSLRLPTTERMPICPYRCQVTFRLTRCNEHFANYTWTPPTTRLGLYDDVVIAKINDIYAEQYENFFLKIAGICVFVVSGILVILLLGVCVKLSRARKTIKLAKRNDEYQKLPPNPLLQVSNEHPYAFVNQFSSDPVRNTPVQAELVD